MTIILCVGILFFVVIILLGIALILIAMEMRNKELADDKQAAQNASSEKKNE